MYLSLQVLLKQQVLQRFFIRTIEIISSLHSPLAKLKDIHEYYRRIFLNVLELYEVELLPQKEFQLKIQSLEV